MRTDTYHKLHITLRTHCLIEYY